MSEFKPYGKTFLDDCSLVARSIGYLESWPPEERQRKSVADDAIEAVHRLRNFIECAGTKPPQERNEIYDAAYAAIGEQLAVEAANAATENRERKVTMLKCMPYQPEEKTE